MESTSRLLARSGQAIRPTTGRLRLPVAGRERFPRTARKEQMSAGTATTITNTDEHENERSGPVVVNAPSSAGSLGALPHSSQRFPEKVLERIRKEKEVSSLSLQRQRSAARRGWEEHREECATPRTLRHHPARPASAYVAAWRLASAQLEDLTESLTPRAPLVEEQNIQATSYRRCFPRDYGMKNADRNGAEKSEENGRSEVLRRAQETTAAPSPSSSTHPSTIGKANHEPGNRMDSKPNFVVQPSSSYSVDGGASLGNAYHQQGQEGAPQGKRRNRSPRRRYRDGKKNISVGMALKRQTEGATTVVGYHLVEKCALPRHLCIPHCPPPLGGAGGSVGSGGGGGSSGPCPASRALIAVSSQAAHSPPKELPIPQEIRGEER